jgi:hypothetical protein
MKKLTIFLIFLFIFQKNFAQSNLCFTPVQVTPFMANSLVFSFAKADFNSDGVQDVCCESYFGVSLLLSNGTGSFSAMTTFSLGQIISTVLTDDFNSDGKADIAAFNPNSNKVFIILGTGTGTVQSIITFSTPTSPKAITSGDFNIDGKKDLAIANHTANSVSIYFGNGTGNFTFSNSYAVGTDPSVIVAGDFNNNGFIDLFVLSNGSTQILKGNGTGLFTVTNYGSIPANILIISDINADGKLDLVYTNTYGPSIYVMTGNSNYTFNSVVSHSLNTGYTTCGGLYAEDFNNDSKVDIVCSSARISSFSFPSNIEFLAGQGSGVFSAPMSFSISSDAFYAPSGFIPIDINNDNKLDVVGHTDNNPGFKILYNCNAVGIKEYYKDSDNTIVYPNPANDKLNIIFTSAEKEITKAQIINSVGQVVKEVDLNNNKQINTEDLPNGVYLLSLRAQERSVKQISKRFVIAR